MSKHRLFSAFGLLLLASLFVLINLLASQLLTRQQLDLTSQRIHSLSQPSLELLAGLQQQIQLQFYYSAKAAQQLPQLSRHAIQVRELLEQYQRLSGGKIKLELLQPEAFSSLEDQAAEAGLQAISLPSGEQLFLGLHASTANGQQHSIEFFDPAREQLLEYQISRLIQRFQQPQGKTVSLLSSLPMDGQFDLISGHSSAPWQIINEVRQQFDLHILPPHSDYIPPDTAVLWVVQPQQLPSATLYAIEQFVLQGGKLLLFVDPFSEQLPMYSSQTDELSARSADISQLLKAWGVQLHSDQVVADIKHAIAVQVAGYSNPVPHPLWLNIGQQGLNREHGITAALQNITLASAGLIEHLTDSNSKLTTLISSSNQAANLATEQLLNLRNPALLLEQIQPSGSSYNMAVHITGSANSIFSTAPEGHDSAPLQSGSLDIILVADTDLLHDSMWLQPSADGQQLAWNDNAAFVLNSLEQLSGGQQLANIRSQVQRSRPFTRVDHLRQQAQQKYTSQQLLLEQRLQHTEQQLVQLRGQQQSSADRQQAIATFLQQRSQIRQQLRQVQHQLNADIQRLGLHIKLFNILLMPFALCFVILLLAIYRRYHPEVSDVA